MEWRLGQTEDLKVRRWPPKGLGQSEWGANGIAHTAHLKVNAGGRRAMRSGAPTGGTGGCPMGLGPRTRWGTTPHPPPGEAQRPTHPLEHIIAIAPPIRPLQGLS